VTVRRRSLRPRAARWLAAATALVALAACSAQTTTSNSVQPGGSSGAASASAGSSNPAEEIAGLPQGAQDNYERYNLFSKIYPNPYANLKAPTGAVKYCLSLPYLGNTWEQTFQDQVKSMVSKLAASGSAQPQVTVTDANNSVATQISQLNSMLQEGCQVVLANPTSATALCPTFDKANKQGVVVVVGAPTYCKSAMNVSFNIYHSTFESAQAIAKALNYKGNILEVTGIPGATDTATNQLAANAAFKGHPGIKVVGTVAGNWTASVAQTAVTQWLATHPTKVDAIMDEGAMGVAAETALQQAGRPLAVTNFYESDCQELAFAKQHPELVPIMLHQAPGPGVFAMVTTAVRILNGQAPKINTILFPIPGPQGSEVDSWYEPSMTVESTCFADPSPAIPAVETYLADFFTGGKPVTVPHP
jgi:ribose transport system substrate-binding protein